MTINTFPPEGEPRILGSHDPAEILAEARVSLRQVPRDCLLLLGHSGNLSMPLITCSDLMHLLVPEHRERLEAHYELMRKRGCTAALALLVIGDGYDDVSDDEIIATATAAGTALLHTADSMLPDPFPITTCWVLAAGTARQVILVEANERGSELAISPVLPLRPFAETAGAAHAVLSGTAVESVISSAALEQAGAFLRIPMAPAERADLEMLFADARGAAARLAAQTSDGTRPTSVTDCELVGKLFSALASDALHWELLALCVDRGRPVKIDRDTLLETLTTDPRCRPHPDVCAGGSWYSALEQLRGLAAGAIAAYNGTQRARAVVAWRGLTTALALLAWWNHRYATAGDLVDEIRMREPASTLAPLLSRMTDTPVPPAWWPRN